MDFTALKSVNALDLFSEYGKMIYNPTGIFYWMGRAKSEAKINATIGSAMGRARHLFDDGGDESITLCIPSIKASFPNLGTEEIFPYAPEAGVPAFRSAWKEWLLRKAGDRADALNNRLIDPIIVPGITGAIGLCTRMFVDPGAPIITPEKRWENYDNVFYRNVGVTVEEFPSFSGGDFNIEGFLGAIRNVWKTHDRAVAILNFPNNPTGYCPPKAMAAQLMDAIHDLVASVDKKLVLMFDDAYEGYVYDDDAEKRSLFYYANPRPNFLPVKLDGVSKELLWYGARIGAITISMPDEWLAVDGLVAELDNKFRGTIRNTVSNCSRVAQAAALKALKNIDAVLAEREKSISLLAERYRLMKQELTKLETDLIEVDPFQGGFFCFVNLKPESGLSASTVCDRMLKEHQVGAVPLEREGVNGIRLAFCGVESEDIPTLCQSLGKVVTSG